MFRNYFVKHWIVFVIFVVALFLRTYNLSAIPVGLHGDEASIGYNAYSLLNTFHDQNGNFLPIAIDQFGDFRPAGYHYLDIPFVAYLSLSELAVRLPAALLGSFAVIAIYLLVYELFENRKMAGLSALLLALLPWDINISRASSESIIATFFVILGVYFYIRYIRRKSTSYIPLVLSGLLLVISFFFYHAHRFFVPAFFPFLIVSSIFAFRPKKKKIIGSFILFGVIFVGLLVFIVFGQGTGRASEVSLLSIPGGTTNLKQAMDEEGTLNPLINRFYNNKLIYYGRFFVNFYTQHLSGDFLFVNNGNPMRYRIPFTGNLYFVMLPFLLFGFASLLTQGLKEQKYHYLMPIAWLLIAPIPAGLTWEDLPNVIRASIMIPALIMITTFGFFEVLSLFKNKNIKTIIVVAAGLLLAHNFLYFCHNYYWRSKIHEPWHRSGAEKELLFQVGQLTKDGENIVMTTERNNNLIFYLFYNRFDPKKFQELGSPREHDGLIFGNIKYTSNPCPIRGESEEIITPTSNTIFVDKEDCPLPKNSEILSTIRFSDGVPAFKIVKSVDAKK